LRFEGEGVFQTQKVRKSCFENSCFNDSSAYDSIFSRISKSINTNQGDPRLVARISWGVRSVLMGKQEYNIIFLYMVDVQILSGCSMEKKEFLSGKYKIK
jgi:hypothetical protein